VAQKIWHHFFLYALTLPNINRFSKLFQCQNQEKICHNTSTKDLTTPQVCRYTTLWNVSVLQENSAKLTNQRVSCAFTPCPFSFHVCHILPTSKFQNSYSCILLIFIQTSVNNMCEKLRTVTVGVNRPTVHWFDAGTPVNNSITLISPVQSLGYIFVADSICVALQISVQFSPKARTPTH